MFRKIVSALMLVMPSVVASVSMAERASDPHVYYFKSKRPLVLDEERVAIFDSAGGAAALTQRSTALNALGLDAATVENIVLQGWVFVPVAAAKRTANDVDDVVARVAASGSVEFISPVFVGDDGGPVVITPDILVQFANGVDRAEANRAIASVGAGTIIEDPFGNMERAYKVRSASRDGFEVLAAANRLALRNDVLFAEPDLIFTGRGSLIPNDPFFTSVWGIHNTGQSGGTVDADMDGPEAWDVTTGDPSIIVVVIDNGVQQNHPDINQIAGTDVTVNPITTGDPFNACDNHGTPVAGCVSAIINNGLGTVGIAPNCRSASVRAFVSNVPCDGTWTTQTSSTVSALAWAESIGARVTNNSNGYGFQTSSIAAKYGNTRAAGMVHFAAAGNDGSTPVSYPASLSSVNAVAALNRFGGRASFSNFGFQLAISAPGQEIVTTDRTGGDGYVSGDYVNVNGTSFASPYAAGVAALVLSVDPTRTAEEVEDILKQTAVDLGTPGFDTNFGWGHVNAFDAVSWNPCATAESSVAEPSPLKKSRYISFVPSVGAGPTAIRVRLTDLMNPSPANLECCPAPDFSAMEGQYRWVGGLAECPDSLTLSTTFKCATLQCAPVYNDWDSIMPGEVLHVTGSAVVPSSLYEVQQILEGCDEGNEADFTDPLTVTTGRWGDVTASFQDPLAPFPATQPDVLDIAAMVDRLRDLPTGTMIKPRAQLQDNAPDPMAPSSVLDVAFTVDAVLAKAYPFTGPEPCN